MNGEPQITLVHYGFGQEEAARTSVLAHGMLGADLVVATRRALPPHALELFASHDLHTWRRGVFKEADSREVVEAAHEVWFETGRPVALVRTAAK